DAPVLQGVRSGGRFGGFAGIGGGIERGYGQAYSEPGALAGTVAVGVNGAAVQFHEFFDDGEAEPEAAAGADLAGFGLAEALEEAGQEFGVDAPPGVADPQFHVVVLALQFHGDAAALGGE